VIRGTGGPVEYSDPARFYANYLPDTGPAEPACEWLYPAHGETRSRGGQDTRADGMALILPGDIIKVPNAIKTTAPKYLPS